jgi:hypothetical protein
MQILVLNNGNRAGSNTIVSSHPQHATAAEPRLLCLLRSARRSIRREPGLDALPMVLEFGSLQHPRKRPPNISNACRKTRFAGVLREEAVGGPAIGPAEEKRQNPGPLVKGQARAHRGAQGWTGHRVLQLHPRMKKFAWSES